MVNGYILPQKALQDGDSCVVKFWRKTKNSANWCAQQSEGIPRKTAYHLMPSGLFHLRLVGLLFWV